MFTIHSRALTWRSALQSVAAGLHASNRYHRRFSLISIHTTFPASLLRLQQQRESTLFEYSKRREDMNLDDGLLVSEDGMVYPRISMELPCQ